MRVPLHNKFQFSSLISTSFRQGEEAHLPTARRTPKKPKQIRVKQEISSNAQVFKHFTNSKDDATFDLTY